MSIEAAAATVPGYCSSSGGSTGYESISSVDVTPTGSGNFKVTVKITIANPNGCTAGNPCPEYDDSPEYVNIWVDFDGDKQWSASERIHDVALTGYSSISYFGSMTTIANFKVPAGATDQPTYLRANLGWGEDPNDPCTSSWSWGNVVDKQVQLSTPKIEKIKVKGVKTTDKLPQTGKEVELTATLKIPTGYEITKCSWSGDLKVGEGDKAKDCQYKYTPGTGEGPKKGTNGGTYGDKKVKLTLAYKHTASGATGQTDKDYEYQVFFGRDDDDDGDKTPNWFEYWKHNKAVNGLDASDVKFDITKGAGSYGSWSSSSGDIKLGPAAAKTHYPSKVKVSSNTNCPGGTFGGAEGINCVAEVLAHERKHEAFYGNWTGSSKIWTAGTTKDSDDPTDSDKGDLKGDMLPDDYETNTTKTDKDNLDSCDLEHNKGEEGSAYKWYGDEEFQALLAGDGKTGNADKDWANPGKKATLAKAAMATAAPMKIHLAAIGDTAGILVSGDSGAVGTTSAPSELAVAQATDAFAHLTGNYSATGSDSDGDGKFDALILSVGMKVVDSGLYTLVGWLRDTSGNKIAWANFQQKFTSGTHTVDLAFSGETLYASGFSGPLTVSNIEIRVGSSEKLVESAQDVFVTASFNAGDFSPPPASLSGQYSDNGVDTDGDGLFDTLDVSVGIEISTEGTYTIIGELETDSGKAIDVATTTAALTISDTSILLSFSGRQIFMSRESGPYLVKRVRIVDSADQVVAIVDSAYQTQAYDYANFQHSGAWLGDQEPIDNGLDLDNDGYFDYLRVEIPLEANISGSYRVSADLVATDSTVLASTVTEVTVGGTFASVDLDFVGHLLYDSGIDGPYMVERLTVIADSGDIDDYVADAHQTAAYSHEDFSNPLVTLTGSMSDFASDDNGNGLYDFLTVSVGVIPLKTGMVFASAQLLDANGTEIGTATGNSDMAAGVEQFIDLEFEGERIGENGVNGPFEVHNLDVYSVFDPGVNTFKDFAGVTNAYDAEEFEGYVNSNPPEAECRDSEMVLDAGGNVTIFASDVDNGSYDPDGYPITYSLSKTNFSCSDIGTQHAVILTITDDRGESDSCTAIVSVVDNLPPASDVASLPQVTGECSAAITSFPTATDNCAGTVTGNTSDSLNYSVQGTYTVAWTFDDSSGNTSSQIQEVVVQDTVAPTAVAKDITVQLDASGNASIVAGDIDNGSSDNCSIASMTVSPANFNCGNIGANTVTLTVTDNSGNVSTATATVIVEDTVAPTAVAKDITVQLDASGNASIVAGDIDNSSSDNCSIASMTVSPANFNCGNIGANTVTLTVTDNSGKIATATATVTVEDVTPPELLVPDDMTVGMQTAAGAEVALTAIPMRSVLLRQI
ncbi:MAG: hypothetical protein D3915_13020, partial [Candidatus Electrothrix sp. AU1_5]|nr:hypothetical protein [Candidatus Electrothrix gigas]